MTLINLIVFFLIIYRVIEMRIIKFKKEFIKILKKERKKKLSFIQFRRIRLKFIATNTQRERNAETQKRRNVIQGRMLQSARENTKNNKKKTREEN